MGLARPLPLGFMCVCHLFILPASLAQESELPNNLYVNIGADVESGNDQYLGLDLNFVADTRVSMAYVANSFSYEDGSLNTSGFNLGLHTDRQATYSFGAAYEVWGEEGEILSDKQSIDFSYTQERWQFSLSPNFRQIEIFFATPDTRHGESIKADSDGFEIDVGIAASEELWLNASYFQYDYSIDVAALRNAPALLISTNTYILISGLAKRGLGLGGSYATDWGLFGLDWYSSTSEIDNSIVNQTQVSILKVLNEAFVVTTRVGWQDNGEDKQLGFWGLGLIVDF